MCGWALTFTCATRLAWLWQGTGACSGFLLRTSRAPNEAKLQYAFRRSSATDITLVSFDHCTLPTGLSRVIEGSGRQLVNIDPQNHVSKLL